MNFIFISPAYPITCIHFCEQLSMLGVNVLGIGDVPYDELNGGLKEALTEYYYVDSLEDYDKVYRAVAFYIHKFGRVDWLESLNEYWLRTDASLRTDFNIETGPRLEEIDRIIKKSEMKKVFTDAGIPTARQHIVCDKASGKDFVDMVGYPVIVKPDVGVGANGAMKIETEAELNDFYSSAPDIPYVMEEFLCGDICTYDAIINSQCEPLFESMCTYPPVIDSVNNDENVHFFTSSDMPEQLRTLGMKTVKAFKADRRFVHFEFIKLKQNYDGIGKAGDFALMEVNMRPAGGHDPDMMNYAKSVDVFRIYAEMVTLDKRVSQNSDQKYYCAYVGRKDGYEFTYSHEEIMERYRDEIVLQEEMPPIDWPSMGRFVYLAKFTDKEKMNEFFDFVLTQQVNKK